MKVANLINMKSTGRNEGKIASDALLCSLLVILLLIMLSSVSGLIGPAEGIEIGRFGFSSEIAAEKAYDNNVYLTKYDRKGSSITTLIPAVKLKTLEPEQIVYLNLGYQAHFKLYDSDKYSNENQYQQTGTWDIGVRPTSKSKVGVTGEDVYNYTKRDERENLFRNNGNSIGFNNFSSTFYLKQGIGKEWDTEFSYTHTERKYKEQDNEDLENSRLQQGNAGFEYKLMKNIFLKAGYRYSSVDFEKVISDYKVSSDYTEQEVHGGFTWDMSSRIKVSANCGQAWREDELHDKGDYLTADARVGILLLRATTVNASYTKSSNYISPQDNRNNFFISDGISMDIRHDLFDQRVTVSYGGRYNVLDYEATDQKDRLWGENVRITWRALKPVMLSMDGSYTKSQYIYDLNSREEYREDKSWSEKAGMEWQIAGSTLLSLTGKYTEFKYRTEYGPEYGDGLDLRKDTLYEGSGSLVYGLNKNIGFELMYQYLQRKSKDKETQKHLENNEYIDNKYSFSLKIAF